MSMIGRQIAKAREAAGMNQSELARALNVKPQAVQKWESGGAPRHSRLPDVANALRVSVSFLMGDESGDGLHSARSESLQVQMLANDASMGGGADLQTEDVLMGFITLTPQFVHEHIRPSSPGALRFIHAYGDSMAPTLNSGDVLLVDTGVQEVKIDGIYVLAAHGRLFVKRVRQRLDGKYEISSDNPTVKTADVLNGGSGVQVVGRVLWYWNGHDVR